MEWGWHRMAEGRWDETHHNPSQRQIECRRKNEMWKEARGVNAMQALRCRNSGQREQLQGLSLAAVREASVTCRRTAERGEVNTPCDKLAGYTAPLEQQCATSPHTYAAIK